MTAAARLAALLALLCACVVPPARAQSRVVIEEVRVHGNYATPDAEVLRLAAIELGTPADASVTTDATPPAAEPAPPAADTSGSAAASTDATASAETGAAANASFTSMTVTNGPVPDTAENRAKYGQPLSHAGKRTTPAGN